MAAVLYQEPGNPVAAAELCALMIRPANCERANTPKWIRSEAAIFAYDVGTELHLVYPRIRIPTVTEPKYAAICGR